MAEQQGDPSSAEKGCFKKEAGGGGRGHKQNNNKKHPTSFNKAWSSMRWLSITARSTFSLLFPTVRSFIHFSVAFCLKNIIEIIIIMLKPLAAKEKQRNNS